MNNDNRWRLGSSTTAINITCTQCDELLDAYLDAALANVDVHSRYPAIWRHLQRCESCSTYYQALCEILHHSYPMRPLAVTSVPLTLPFLHRSQARFPNQAERPWRVYLRSPLMGEPFLLRFSFSPAYLQNLAGFSTATMSRLAPLANSEAAHSPPYLLFERIPLGRQTLVVKLVAFWTNVQSGFVRLQATLISPCALSIRLQATLQWGALARTCRVSQTGEADLGEVPVAALQPGKAENAPVFAITFAAITVSEV